MMKKYFCGCFAFFLFFAVGFLGSLYAEPRKILVYGGPGTDCDLARSTIEGLKHVLAASYTFEIVGAEHFREEQLDVGGIAAVVFPGGSSATLYANALGDVGRARVVNYVRRGGNALTFCAGTYAFARERCFVGVQGTIGPVILPPGQFLFAGTAYGPALAAYNMRNVGASATAASVRWASNRSDLFLQYWNGGPVLSWDDERENNGVFPELHYADPLYRALPTNVLESRTPIAATMGPYGNGYYGIFGTHPEYDIVANVRNGQWNANPNAGWMQTIRELPRSLSLLRINKQMSRYILSVFIIRMGLRVRPGLNPVPDYSRGFD